MKSLLPHDVIEDILERLPVQTLLKFKCVSKQWKFTIESLYFEKRQMFRRKQSGDPDVLFVSVYSEDFAESALGTLVVGSLDSAKIPTPWDDKFYLVCKNSCDGLICLYYLYNPCIVVNPTTRWYRTFPRSNYQLAARRRLNGLGFGKDKINGTYKPVWLYNSAEVGLNNNATTCEVFDFTTNAWRFVAPASPYLIIDKQEPVYVDGSLHWLTAWLGETKVLSFDFHTETFQVISKVPLHYHYDLSMCNLDDRLCVFDPQSVGQGIWSFDSGTWKKMYSIEYKMAHSWFDRCMLKFEPLAIVDKDKLLYYDREYIRVVLVTHDPKTKSYDLAFKSNFRAFAICYFPSLISIL